MDGWALKIFADQNRLSAYYKYRLPPNISATSFHIDVKLSNITAPLLTASFCPHTLVTQFIRD